LKSRSFLGDGPIGERDRKQKFWTVKSENISVGLRIIPVPTKTILDAFRNISRSMISSAKSNQSGSGSSGTFPVFIPENSQKFPE
jgi:hypothetical protein